jgi:hypothetical protein
MLCLPSPALLAAGPGLVNGMGIGGERVRLICISLCFILLHFIS